MSDFFTTDYRPPGVYTSEETAPTVGSVGIGPTVVAIVGPSVGYMTATEAVVLNGTTNTRLQHNGIVQNSIVVTKADNTEADLTDDYTLTVGTGADATASTGDDTTDIKRAGSSTIGDGETVIVAYRYTDPTYFTAKGFTDFASVRDTYGPPLNTETGAIVSPLSFAAKCAFDNGAARIILLAVPGSATTVDKDDLADGYAKLMSREEVSIVVPLPVGINGTDLAPADTGSIGSDLANHVDAAFEQGIRRIAILGYETGVSVDPIDLAAGIDNSRVAITWPSRMSYFNAFLNQSQEVGGYYAAAAEAGRLSTLPVNFPLTRKVVAGLSISSPVSSTITRANKDEWGKAGVMVLETNTRGVLIVRHGTSTDTTNVLTRELSITRQADTMIRSCTEALDAADLIGSPIVDETPARIKGIISNVLETVKDAEIIFDYNSLTVRQTSVDPSVIEVRFRYRPTYPLNYVNIVFGVDPTTGDVTDITEEA